MADQDGNRTKAGTYLPGTSGNTRGRPRTRVNEAELTARRERILARLDGWNNTTTGLGITGKDKSVTTGFFVDIVDPELGAQIWRGDAVGARIVELLPNEMLRQGYDLRIGDDLEIEPYEPPEPEQPSDALPVKGVPDKLATKQRTDHSVPAKWRQHQSAFSRRVSRVVGRQRRDSGDIKGLQERVEKKLRDIHADVMIREAMHYERAICAGALLIGANDYTTDLRKPLDLRRVRSLDYLTPIEARELTPLYWYNDPFAPRFGDVAIYQLIPQIVGSSLDGQYRNGITQVHESRLIVFPGIKTTRRNLAGAMNGFGDNVFTRIYRALRGYNSANQNAETLLADFAQAVYKIKGLAELMMRDKNALFDSMMNVELSRAIARAIVIDSEEEFERKSTSLAGYSDVLNCLTQNLCASTGYPATLLVGKSPDGMNATGSSDIRLFYDHVATGQTQRVAPPIMRLVEIEIACAGQDPETVNHSVEFCPLWQPTQKEVCEAQFIQAQTDEKYVTMEAASPEEVAITRFAGDQFSYAPIRVDFEARHAMTAIAPPTVEAKPPKPVPPALAQLDPNNPIPPPTEEE